MSGKFTLTKARVGQMYPCLRPLAIRQPDAVRVSTDAAGFGAVLASCPHLLGVVAYVTFDEEASLAIRQTTPRGETPLGLVDKAVAARSARGEILAMSALVAGRCPGLTGPRGDAETTARKILALLSDAG